MVISKVPFSHADQAEGAACGVALTAPVATSTGVDVAAKRCGCCNGSIAPNHAGRAREGPAGCLRPTETK